MIGTVVGLATGAYGKKPKIPELEKLSPAQVQKDTVAGNLGVLPEAAEQVGERVNAFNAAQLKKLQTGVLPMYETLLNRASGITESQLKGELPTDVVDFVRRQSLAAGIGSGTAGSGFARARTARDLGLRSLDLVREGLSNFSNLTSISRALIPSPFDVTSMFLTPAQQYSMQNEQNLQQFQRQMAVNEIRAAGDPKMQALAVALDNFESQLMSMGAGFAGMAVCWVAREVYGASNPRWVLFYLWLSNLAPKWFLSLYLKHGKAFSAWIRGKETVKGFIRGWMDSRIKVLERRCGING